MNLEGIAIGVLVLLAVVVILMLAVVAFLGYRLIKMYSVVRDPAAPGSAKLAFWLAVIYTLSPIDLMPDPILIDDMAVLVGALSHIGKVGRSLGVGTHPAPNLSTGR